MCHLFMELAIVGENVLEMGVEAEELDAATASASAPYVGLFDHPLEVGSLITVTGKTSASCERFAINLACGTLEDKEPDMALHLNPRISRKYVVRNSRYKGQWGSEETTSYRSFPFDRDKEFRVDIFVAEQIFFIQINGKHFCSYSERLALNKIIWMNVTGNVEVEKVSIGSASEYPVLEPFGQSTPDVPSLTSTDDEVPLQNWDPMVLANLPRGLTIGHQLVVRGRIQLLPHSFFINIQEEARIWPRPTVMFHFNPRFTTESTKQVIVFNTRDNDNWGVEERTWASRMHAGSEIELVVTRGAERYSCWVRDWTSKEDTQSEEEPQSMDGSDIHSSLISAGGPEVQHTLLGSFPARTTNTAFGAVHMQGNFAVSQIFICPIAPQLAETVFDEEYSK